MKNPCSKHCLDRELGCHSVCEAYKAFRAYLDEKSECIRKENEIYGYKKIKHDKIEKLERKKRKYKTRSGGDA